MAVDYVVDSACDHDDADEANDAICRKCFFWRYVAG